MFILQYCVFQNYSIITLIYNLYILSIHHSTLVVNFLSSLKSTTSDLFKLHFNHHSLQHFTTGSISFNKPLHVNDVTTKSSANNNVYLKTIHNLKATCLTVWHANVFPDCRMKTVNHALVRRNANLLGFLFFAV